MTTLLIDHSGYFLVAALRDGTGVINQLWLEPPKGDDIRTGEVLCGRVRSVNPRSGAAYADIGGAGDGYVNLSRKTRPGGIYPVEGAQMIFGVKRPPIGKKGCLLTLPARYGTLWVQWTAAPEGVSARAPVTETAKADNIPGTVVPYRSSTGMPGTALEAHLETLAATHRQLVSKLQAGHLPIGAGHKFPPLIALMIRAVRLDIDEVIFGQADLWQLARQAIPRWGTLAGGRYNVWTKRIPLAAHVNSSADGLSISDQIDESLTPIVALPGGGRLIIEETAACVAVDIDLGAATGQSKAGALRRLCDHALPALAREVSCRQLGGQMIIDFPAALYRHARAIETQLCDIFAAHPGAKIGRMTRGGLLDITLPRTAASLREMLSEPVYEGPLRRDRLRASYWADKAARALYNALYESPGRQMRLHVSQKEGALLERAAVADRFAAQFGPRFEIITDPARENGNADVI